MTTSTKIFISPSLRSIPVLVFIGASLFLVLWLSLSSLGSSPRNIGEIVQFADKNAALRREIAQLATFAERRALLEADIAALHALIENDPRFLPSSDPGRAQASLQRRVSQAATRASVELQSTRMITADDTDDNRSIEIVARGDYAAMLNLIANLETGAPRLFTHRLDLTTTDEKNTLALRARLLGAPRPTARRLIQLQSKRPEDQP